jgi:hypothetical protein
MEYKLNNRHINVQSKGKRKKEKKTMKNFRRSLADHNQSINSSIDGGHSQQRGMESMDQRYIPGTSDSSTIY